jgi:ankyrin repeat protein
MDPKGNTLLHFLATSTGLDESVQLMLADLLLSHAGNDLLTALNQENDSVLRLACFAGNWKLASFLLHAPLDPEAVKEMCIEAIAGANWETLDEILRITKGTEQMPNISELQLSLCAIPLFQREMVATPTAQGMEVLVKHSADVTCYDRENRTTIALATRAGNTDYVEFILKYLGCVTETGITESGSMELDTGSDLRQEKEFLNWRSVDGETALSSAIMSGNTKVVQWLLDLDVDVEWSNVALATRGQKISALLIAYQAMRYLKNDEIVQLIQARHPDVLYRRDYRGRLLLHSLAAGDNEANTIICMQKALASGLSALINTQDDQGFTPLHIAVVGGVAKNIEFLLNHGSDPMIADSRGYSVLHLAIEDYGQDDYPVLGEFFKGSPTAATARLLDSQDLWGRTVLMHAAGKFVPSNPRGTAALLFLLEKASPQSLQIRDTYNQTALHHFYGRCATIENEGKDPTSKAFQIKFD